MRIPLAAAGLSFAAGLVFAQNPAIDLNVWTEEQINGTAPWTVDAGRLFAESTNQSITDVSVFYSDFDVVVLDFRMTIAAGAGDDDLAGFILGWQPGDSANVTADYILVDWKRITQPYQNWGTANAGLALSRMTGTFTRGFGSAPIDLWSHTGNCTELARGVTYGTVGWEFGENYFFRVVYTPTSVDVWCNDSHEFSLTGTFTPGRFACYNFSQHGTGFQFPVAGSLNRFGTSCTGTYGFPYFFSPGSPYVGESLPFITANINPAAVPFVILGISNQNYLGTALPASLGTYGGGNCSLYVSADYLLPATNFNGTAYTTFKLPPGLLPSATPVLYAQGMLIDPGANQLGLVLAEAIAIAPGIR